MGVKRSAGIQGVREVPTRQQVRHNGLRKEKECKVEFEPVSQSTERVLSRGVVWVRRLQLSNLLL